MNNHASHFLTLLRNMAVTESVKTIKIMSQPDAPFVVVVVVVEVLVVVVVMEEISGSIQVISSFFNPSMMPELISPEEESPPLVLVNKSLLRIPEFALYVRLNTRSSISVGVGVTIYA